MSLLSCSNLEIRVCKFVVPYRAGLKAVFGNTVVDSLVVRRYDR
jgi:hypothetical protein